MTAQRASGGVLIKDFDAGIIDLQHMRGEGMIVNPLCQWLEGLVRSSDDIGESGAGQLNALAPEDRPLPMER